MAKLIVSNHPKRGQSSSAAGWLHQEFEYAGIVPNCLFAPQYCESVEGKVGVPNWAVEHVSLRRFGRILERGPPKTDECQSLVVTAPVGGGRTSAHLPPV